MRSKNVGDGGTGVCMREGTTSRLTAADRPNGKFYDFGSTLVFPSPTLSNKWSNKSFTLSTKWLTGSGCDMVLLMGGVLRQIFHCVPCLLNLVYSLVCSSIFSKFWCHISQRYVYTHRPLICLRLHLWMLRTECEFRVHTALIIYTVYE